jgi:hypothetical protein
VSSIRNWLERRFGYNRITEFINAIIAVCLFPLSYIRYQLIYFRALKTCKKVVIITCSYPQHVENIKNIPDMLRDNNIQVIFFAEWYRKKHKNYHLNDFEHYPIFWDCWHFMPFVKAHMLLSATAGKHVYYPRGSLRVHYFHSIANLSGFPKFAFDSFDVLFCAGPHQIIELEEDFSKRGISDRLLLKAGYPKLDIMYREYCQPEDGGDNLKTVVYCPTYYSQDIYSDESTVNDLAFQIIGCLLTKYNVIFRPHPLNLKKGNIENVLDLIRKEYSQNTKFTFDEELSYASSYSKADIMLSDISGTAFTFALSSGKPVLFFDKGVKGMGIQYEKREMIGEVISNLDELIPTTEKLLTDVVYSDEKIKRARAELVYHFNESEKIYLLNILELLGIR